jgi:cystathionine gamma-synthase
MERACSSALAIAEWLASCNEVEFVYYPGLPQSPDFGRASRQFSQGFGSMLSFCVSNSAKAAAVSKATKVMRQSTSLGSTETLIEHRAVTEGAGTRCPDNLIRLSIGLEHPGDLIADLASALRG